MWLSSASLVGAQTQDALQFSGFARVVLGYLDESNAKFLGYNKRVSLKQQSLIGLQADYQITNNLSATAQFIGHTAQGRNSGIEWLYLTYEPTRATQIKIGKQRTPFFNYSDSIDIGFAYPWITLPQQVYKTYFFSTFDGVLANYQWSGKKIAFDIEGYWGSFDDSVYTIGNFGDSSSNVGTELLVNANDLRGLIGTVTFDSWILRASYHTTDTFIDITKLKELSHVLDELGFTQTANSLSSDGQIEFYQVAASYENMNYFFRLEMTEMHTESSTIPDIDGFFMAAGYHYYPFLSYVSFAKNSSSYGLPIHEIPIGSDPQLDVLAATYQNVMSQLPFDSSQSITLGTRWDIKANFALKAEVTWTDADVDSSATFFILNDAEFDNKAPLYQLALEWIF